MEGGNQSEGLKIAQKIEEKIEENLKAILIESEFGLIKFHEKIIAINNTKYSIYDSNGNVYNNINEINRNGIYLVTYNNNTENKKIKSQFFFLNCK